MKKTNILLISILLCALILRIYGINWGLPSKDYYFSYHSDEVNYIRGLSKMNPAKFDFNPHFFNWGILHYYELGSVIGLAGFLNVVKLTKDKYFYYAHPNELAKIYLLGRFLSVFFALATIFSVFLIGKRLYDVKTGLLASFYMAINPGHIIHSHYLKADISVTFWVTLLLFGAAFLLETGRLKWYIFSGIFSAMAFGAQQNGICFILTLLFAHLLLGYKSKEINLGFLKDSLKSKKLYLGYLSFFITYLIINPYTYLSPQEFMSGIRNVLFRQGGGIDIIDKAYMSVDTIRAFSIGLTPYFVLIGIIAIVYGILSKSKNNSLIIFWLLPYLALMVIAGALNTRHQILIYPGVLLLAARSTQFFYSKIQVKGIRLIFAYSIIAATFYSTIYSYAYDKELAREKTIQQEASQWLVSNVPLKSRIGIPSYPEIRNYPAIIHQDYYYKENNVYEIINLRSNPDNLIIEKPEYIIFSRRRGLYSNKVAELAESSSTFMKMVEDRYRVIKTFERWPTFLSFSFKPTIVISEDWEMPFPIIYILKRKD